MRPKALDFEQLVIQNKQELLNDEESITQIELRLENKQEAIVLAERQKNQEKITAGDPI
ncbi:FbpB family small basic protein [Oceanobacillus sp. 1P07AA]|uniref:FbpB family small basic protein n=1 Tax=Oceanobacillus sp. 1P07AA TaxID=3132293 RepID=UPI0039A597C8